MSEVDMSKVNIDGVNIFYEVRGQGDPLVMIQGYGQYSLQWGSLPDELARQYRVVLIDNRGTGRSDKPDTPMTIPMLAADVARVLDALSIDKAHIFGVSKGGLIAQRFAINYPQRVIHLILGCSIPGGEHHIQPPADGMRILFDVGYLKSRTPEQLTLETFRFLCTDEFIEENPEAYRYYHRVTMANPTPGYTYKHQAAAIDGEDTWAGLADIRMPTMFITGTSDRLVPCENSEIMAKQVTGAELVMLQDKRHGFYIEAMESTRTSIDDFIKRHKLE